MNALFRNPRALFSGVAGASLALAGAGVLMTHAFNLAACPLCILQRMAYLLLALCAGLGLAFANRRIAPRIAALLMTVTAATGAFIAGYQVWIQRIEPTITCGGKQPWWERFVDWAGRQLPYLFEADGLCADPAWSFLSLSIADWSALAFLGLLVISLIVLFMSDTRP